MKNRNISSQPDTPRKTKRKPSADRVLYLIVVASFILPIVFIVLRMIFGDNGMETEIHSDADYVLMLVECVLGLFVINIPNLLSKRLRFTLPIPLYVLYILSGREGTVGGRILSDQSVLYRLFQSGLTAQCTFPHGFIAQSRAEPIPARNTTSVLRNV